MIKSLWHRIRKSEFFIAVSSTGFTSALQILTGLVINKIIAVKIGPSGIALLGQFANFRDILTTFGTGAIGQGVTKYVADKDYKDKNVITTATLLTVIISICIGTFIMLFSERISNYLFKTASYTYVLRIFSLTITFFSLNNLLIAIVNGRRKFLLLAKIRITNSIVSLIISGLLCWFYSLKGALTAMAINTSIVFFISLVIYFFENDRFIIIKRTYFENKILKKLLAFSLMALTSVILKPIIELILRNYIITHGTDIEAGLWESMKRLSTYYNQIIMLALGAYYLPKLSSIQENSKLRIEIFKGIKRVMPIFVGLAFIIYFSKNIIIELLFSENFLPMKILFLPQLIGDFFMILSFLIAYLMLAKAMTKTYIITQLIMASLRITFSISFFQLWGIEGVIWANALNYFIYTFLMIIIFRKILFA